MQKVRLLKYNCATEYIGIVTTNNQKGNTAIYHPIFMHFTHQNNTSLAFYWPENTMDWPEINGHAHIARRHELQRLPRMNDTSEFNYPEFNQNLSKLIFLVCD